MSGSKCSAVPERPPTGEELLLKVAQGDRAAFELLYRMYERVAYELACYLSWSRSDAEDIHQQAFLDLWRKASHFDPLKASARVWILGLVRTQMMRVDAKSKLRQRRHVQYLQKREIRPDPLAVASGQGEDGPLAVLRSLQDQMPESDRRLLGLYFGLELTQDEIAALLDIPQRTISHRIGLILKGLRGGLARAGYALADPTQVERLLEQVVRPAALRPASALRIRVLEGLGTIGNPGAPRAGNASWALLKSHWLPLTVVGALAVAACAGGLAGWGTLAPGSAMAANSRQSVLAKGASEEPLPIPRERFKKVWGFDSPQELADFKVHPHGRNGVIAQIPGEGLNGSGCLLIEDSDLFFELAAAASALRVSILGRIPPATREAMDVNLTVGWPELERVDNFRNVGPRYPLEHFLGRWTPFTFYLSGERGEHWVDGRRVFIWFHMGGTRRKVFIGTPTHLLLDELTIQEIALEEMPEASEFEAAHTRLAPLAVPDRPIAVPWLRAHATPGREVLYGSGVAPRRDLQQR